ncbi:hypothetical protein CLF_105186 [Clonorchis sinensis]|uniref:Uncharacterized protein n=1 Tax=Clonorchis sinensis TaxID=79923 RepID=G7YD54_CLOSI|nr:hypothetical protein CLF_105186 [Clonorchis sinensis]
MAANPRSFLLILRYFPALYGNGPPLACFIHLNRLTGLVPTRLGKAGHQPNLLGESAVHESTDVIMGHLPFCFMNTYFLVEAVKTTSHTLTSLSSVLPYPICTITWFFSEYFTGSDPPPCESSTVDRGQSSCARCWSICRYSVAELFPVIRLQAIHSLSKKAVEIFGSVQHESN